MASEAQRGANKRNGQRPTGPRTKKGKSISSRNAVTHRGAETRGLAVLRGDFAEDESEVAALVESTADALQPRDELERTEARNVAVCYLRLRRVDRLESHAIAGAERCLPGRSTKISSRR